MSGIFDAEPNDADLSEDDSGQVIAILFRVHMAHDNISTSKLGCIFVGVVPSRSQEPENVKRLFDIVVATAILLALAPVVALVALTIGYKLGWPIIFTQARPGRHGRLFNMVKFRTMSNERDASGNLLPDQQRLGRFGRFVRSTSLDELPELWNVIRGDMSLVGPRPLFEHYLPLYSAEQSRRHEVRPGITGWAQVNGRNDVDWPARFALDVWYVDNHSLWLDMKILLLTLLRVVQRDGINPQGKIEMELFTGQTK